jgi:negative regulator of flagellin synthesis FlgM
MSYQNGVNTLQQMFSQVSASNVAQTQQTDAAKGGAKTSTESAVATSAPTDTTSLSTLGGLAASSTDSDVRMDKVSALQSAINSGSYNVSSSDVADAVINSLMQ